MAEATFRATPEVARHKFLGAKAVLGRQCLQKGVQSLNGDVVFRDDYVEDLSPAIEALDLPRGARAVFHDA